MAKSGIKQKRMAILDSLLKSGKKVSFQEVAANYEKALHKAKGNEKDYKIVYNNDFRQDINDIRKTLESGIPGLSRDMLVAEGPKKKTLYWYRDRGFSIMPYYGYYYSKYDQKKCDEALTILKENLPEDVYDTVEFELKCLLEQTKSSERLIDYGENPRLRRREWLPRLSKALNKTALRIIYEPFDKPDRTFKTFFPYLLKLYNNRWFLFGRNEEKCDNYWNVPVDRIKDFEEIQDVVFKKRPKQYMNHFLGFIGVHDRQFDGDESGDQNDKALEERLNQKQKREEIVLKVMTRSLWGRMKTKPLHESQYIVTEYDDELGYGMMIVEIIPNVEFYNQLTSLGENIIVESPAMVREIVKKRLRNTLKKYENGE